ncbi:hypothetical protein QYB63_002957 [Clostridium perfringens]|nr:hypothetical protein [Clostridium perfringens]
MYEFNQLETNLTINLWSEFYERLLTSLYAIDCVFEENQQEKEEARKNFQINFEIISLLQFKNFQFKKEYEEEVRREWSEE